MGKHNVSRRIASDRGVAGFFAFIASLPALAVIAGLLYVGYKAIADFDETEANSTYVILGVIALFCVLFFIIARWTYDAVHAALTPQRVQAMWLRRFQAEG